MIKQNIDLKELQGVVELVKLMTLEERSQFFALVDSFREIEDDRILSQLEREEEYLKALFMVDMNNGFVNFGAMANPAYNDLVPEQLKLIEKFKRENQLLTHILEGHVWNAVEFKTYPGHCKRDTPEAEVIPQFKYTLDDPNTQVFYKNSINGMLNLNVQQMLKRLVNLKEIVIGGVCADLCVMDFARTLARFMDEINREIKIFVVKSTIDTFDAPGHNRQEWLDISYKVMEQAGIELVEDFDHLERRERELGLYLRK